jgi:hypothetical protein
MDQKVLIKNKTDKTVFELTTETISTGKQAEKGGEHLYLLEYDYAKDLLVNNKDPDEVIKDLRTLTSVIVSEVIGEEVYVLAATVLEADMIKAYANIEFGSILKLNDDGSVISSLLDEEKDAFSIVDESELNDLHLEELSISTPAGEYVDPAEALVQASKQSGCDSYNRKDVLEKFAEEKKENAS